MTHSIYRADRTTHFKIVVVALVAGIGMAGLGVSARIEAGDEYSTAERMSKADQPNSRPQDLRSC